MKYIYHGASLQNGRDSNMDSLLMKQKKIADKNLLLAVVCDGVGSMKEGAFASRQTVGILADWFENLSHTERIGLVMRDVILRANADIAATASRLNINTAATVSALLLVEDTYYIVHAGDSRIYCHDGKGLSLLTNDDAVDGKLTAYIGRKADTAFQYFEGIAGGKAFLLCSDGLYRKMNHDFMSAMMEVGGKRKIKESAAALIRFVTDRGERDNISLIIIKSEK